jgi:hypothetical protein
MMGNEGPAALAADRDANRYGYRAEIQGRV